MAYRVCLTAAAVTALVLLLTLRIGLAAETIEPNPALQAQIAQAAAARNAAELDTALAALKAGGGPHYAALIPQLVYALMHATDEPAAMIPGVIIDRLGISKEQLRTALAPYRTTSDARLKRQIDNLLGE